MTEQVLLNSGYKQYDVPVYKQCDRFYQKKLNNKEYFNVYYYDTFKENSALDYKFEYEYVNERDNYWYSTYIWALDKNCLYTIEEIESILIGSDNVEKNEC